MLLVQAELRLAGWLSETGLVVLIGQSHFFVKTLLEFPLLASWVSLGFSLLIVWRDFSQWRSSGVLLLVIEGVGLNGSSVLIALVGL
jgi:hypothetical protein